MIEYSEDVGQSALSVDVPFNHVSQKPLQISA